VPSASGRARALLERRGIAFEKGDLSADPERCFELEALTGGRSAPQIVIDGRPIGGFAELSAVPPRRRNSPG
jgi:glutaredoxin 3